LFLALTEKGFAEVAQIPLCCQNSPDSCFDNSGSGGLIKCKSEDDLVPGAFCDEATNLCTRIDNVPTLSEWGLISMAAILGIVGFMVLRRRKVSA